MNADLIAVLNLRRQAAALGWRLAARRDAGKEVTFRFEHIYLDGYIKVYSGWWRSIEDCAPTRVVVNAAVFMILEKASADRAAAVIPSLLGWDTDVDSVWPPRPQPLIRDRRTLALLAGGVR